MRITESEIKELVNWINRHYCGTVVEFGHRYDYYALDRIDPNTGNPSGSALVTGTKKEIYLYLRGMCHSIDLTLGMSL